MVGIILVLNLLFWAIKNDCPTLILYIIGFFSYGPTIPAWQVIFVPFSGTTIPGCPIFFYFLFQVANQECLLAPLGPALYFFKVGRIAHFDFIFFESFSLWANHSCLTSNFCSF
jgi:hypothetical protein